MDRPTDHQLTPFVRGIRKKIEEQEKKKRIQILELPLPLLFKGLGPSSLPTAVSSTSTVHLSVCPCVCSAVCTLGSIKRLYRKMRRIRKRNVFSKKKSLLEKK